jgi:hypothetical protein
MTPSTIAIEVDPETAQAFAAASPAERRKLALLLRLRLRELTVQPSRPLKEIMDDIARDAETRGLTPDQLKSLLDDE